MSGRQVTCYSSVFGRDGHLVIAVGHLEGADPFRGLHDAMRARSAGGQEIGLKNRRTGF